MRPEKLSDLVFARLPFRHRNSQLIQRTFRSVGLHTIELQEDEGGDDSGPLVAINERVVPDDVERIGSGHIKQRRVPLHSVKASLRLGDSRLQEAHIPHSRGPAIQLELAR